jgi:hypothetical protein
MTPSTLISVVALAAALSIPTAALAQDASVSASASTEAGAGAGDNGASASAQAGAGAGASTNDNGANASTSTEVNASTSQSGGGSTNVGIQTDVNVNVTTEQTTEIRQVIVQSAPPAVTVNFDISLGVVVPAELKVKLLPLPARVIEIVPQFQGFLFFVLADGRIVIVAPDTLKIAAIITV